MKAHMQSVNLSNKPARRSLLCGACAPSEAGMLVKHSFKAEIISDSVSSWRSGPGGHNQDAGGRGSLVPFSLVYLVDFGRLHLRL